MEKLQIQDLSIGDWVQRSEYKEPLRVCLIDGVSLTVELAEELGGTIEVAIDEVTGIPITPEILEKNGFVKRDTYNWNNPKIRCTAYRFGRKYWDIRVTYRAGDYRPTRINIENIVYVHELQHAIRMAGAEKEIEHSSEHCRRCDGSSGIEQERIDGCS